MTALWPARSIPSNRLSHLRDSVSAAGPSSCCIPDSFNAFYIPRRDWLGLVSDKRSRLKACAADPTRKNDLQENVGVWEEPDGGSDCEYDDEAVEGEEDEGSRNFENDGRGVSNDSSNPISSTESAEIDYAEALVKASQTSKEFELRNEVTLLYINHSLIKWIVSCSWDSQHNNGENLFLMQCHPRAEKVELLLSLEERAILQKSRIPNLQKTMTAKWSPLHTLAMSSQIRCMDKLLDFGLDINFTDQYGLTALHKAVIGKKRAVITHLLRKGANPHVRDKDGATPLHYAVQSSDLQTVKLLVKYRVDVNVADHDGWTALHITMQSRKRDIVKILLVNGADKSRKNKDGNTALDLSLCFPKNFNTFNLAQLLKLVPADTDF